MPRAIRLFVHYVEALNRRVGRAAMYLIFGMMGVLLYSTISRAVFNVPLIWVVEVAQMTMAAASAMACHGGLRWSSSRAQK